jgi:short-subunit dehydrogenase
MTTKVLGTALITGASTGIGAIYADRLVKRGYDLILVARDVARLESLAARLQVESDRTIEVLPADLTDRAQLGRIEVRLATDVNITLLVNNAGMSLPGTLFNTSLEIVERMIALNVTATTVLSAAAIRAFVPRKAGGIINLSSVLALAPEAFDGAYSSTKAFVLNLSQGMVKEADENGVRIQVVLPGATRTEIWERSGKDLAKIPADKLMEAGDLVDAALKGFDRGETVTIPSLRDIKQWESMQHARLAMGPNLSRREVAERYRNNSRA